MVRRPVQCAVPFGRHRPRFPAPRAHFQVGDTVKYFFVSTDLPWSSLPPIEVFDQRRTAGNVCNATRTRDASNRLDTVRWRVLVPGTLEPTMSNYEANPSVSSPSRSGGLVRHFIRKEYRLWPVNGSSANRTCWLDDSPGSRRYCTVYFGLDHGKRHNRKGPHEFGGCDYDQVPEITSHR